MDDFQAQRQIAQAYVDGVREGREAVKREVRELAEDCKLLCGVDQEEVFKEELMKMFNVVSVDEMHNNFLETTPETSNMKIEL